MPWKQTRGGTYPGMTTIPPEKCDLCDHAITIQEPIYDGCTSFGKWAWMCRDCYYCYGVGLGVGKGQEYQWEVTKPTEPVDPLSDLKKFQAMLTIGAVLFNK